MPKSVEEEYFQQAHEQYQKLIETLTEEQTQEWEHGEIESYINNSGTELLRRLLQGHLDLRSAQKSRNPLASKDELLVLTSDGKGIVMHSEDLREATAQAASKSSSTRKTRLSPGQKRQRKRMATVASVYSVPRYSRRPEDIIGDQRDPPERPKIHDKRVWASVRQDAQTVIASAFAEALGRDPEKQQDWVVLVDGEPHQLKTIKAMAKKQKLEPTIILDFIHVLEYLWKAAYCFWCD